jgi:hypothetical protein
MSNQPATIPRSARITGGQAGARGVGNPRSDRIEGSFGHHFPAQRHRPCADEGSCRDNARVCPGDVREGSSLKANPGYFTRIRARFDLPVGVHAPQRYVYHCHIVEHEDNDMMRPFTVTA